MKTDVVIISKGKGGLIYRALDSIHDHSNPKEIGKICLSWNGDKDTLKKVERQLKSLRFDYAVEKIPYHFSQNNNIMVKKHCQSDVVLFLNDDIQLQDDFISKGIKLLEKQQVGFVGCKLVRPDETIQHAGVIAFVDGVGNLIGPAHYLYNYQDSKDTEDWTPLAVTGACMMCRRELFNSLGGFNEEYAEGFQDFDICVRAVCANLTNVCLNERHCQLHDESVTRDKKVLQHDSDLLSYFWHCSITKLMKSQSASCVGICERRVKQ